MEKINFIDVGCDNNKKGCIISPWNENIEYINFLLGFDPLLTNSYKEEIEKTGIKHKLYKKGAFSSNCNRKFYKLFKKDSSSFNLPNLGIINKNKSKKKKDMYNIESVEIIECIRIDSVINELKIDFDFVKIDVQGDEYNAIESIGDYLDTQIIGVCVEVNYIKNYKNIILKKKVHKLLTRHKFYRYKKNDGVSYVTNDYLYIRDDEKKNNKVGLIKKIYEDWK